MATLAAAAANPIASVELIAIWVALLLWGDLCMHRAILAFVDNDPARHALVRGGSGVEGMAAIVDAICDLEIQLRALAYFERVPSQSNIADPPSRGEHPGRLAGYLRPEASMCEHLGRQTVGSTPGHLLTGIRDLSFA